MKHLNQFIFAATLVVFCQGVQAQSTACPNVDAGPDVTICGGCTQLNMNVQGTVTTTSYSLNAIPYNPYPFNQGTQILVGIDDVFSDTIVLPFCFEFYGVTYTRCVIGSNGIISFETNNAQQYNTWPIGAPMPDPTVPDLLNSIQGPWHDIDPSVGGDIYFDVVGTAPCRQLIVSWNQIPMFSCNNLINTQQTILYETTNVIDVFIQNKPICSSWNSGAAIECIQDATGSTAVVVPGRNYPSQWAATNDGYRWTPTGTPQYTVNWLQNNVSIGTTPSINVCPTVTTAYVAQVVNQTCSGPITVTDTVVVTVGNGSLTLTTSSTPTTCTGSTGTATATPTGTSPYTYSWAPGGQTTQTITGLPTGTYTVFVTDAQGCQASMTVTVTASNNNITLSTANTPTNCTANNGTATVTPSGGQSPYTYSWSPGGQTTATATGLGAGTYTVFVTDANGCTSTATVVVAQNNNNLTLNINTPQPICSGGNATLNATVAGGTGPYTYSWVPGGQTASSITVTPTSTTSYNCYVTDANGCTVLQTVTVNVDPPITASVNGLNTICAGASTIITVSAGGGTPAYSYSWIPSGGSGTAATVSPTTTTTYSVIVTDVVGCSITSTGVTITVSPTPLAAFSANPPTGSPNTLVNFTDLSTISTGTITCWSWTFGDGSPSSSLQNPAHSWTSPGSYNVCLVICDPQCPDTVCQVYVVEPTEVIIPNVITPNGDGKNDTLIFTNLEYYPQSALRIYNRWGALVYESSDYKNNWTGADVSDGTYYFILLIAEKNEEVKGFVEVLGN